MRPHDRARSARSCWPPALIGGSRPSIAQQGVPIPKPAPKGRDSVQLSGDTQGAADDRRDAHRAAGPGHSRSASQRADQYFRDLRRQPEGAGRQGQQLSLVAADAGRQFRAGRARRHQDQGRLLHPEARQGPLRIRSADADRHHRRRLVARGARPQSRDAGHLSAVADAVALPAVRPHRPDEGHQCRQRHRGRSLHQRHHRGEAGADRHQPADADDRRQGRPAQAVDRHRPAGLRHHGRGLQSRHHQEGRSRACSRSTSRSIRPRRADNSCLPDCFVARAPRNDDHNCARCVFP